MKKARQWPILYIHLYTGHNLFIILENAIDPPPLLHLIEKQQAFAL
jgi:hypothetical protein